MQPDHREELVRVAIIVAALVVNGALFYWQWRQMDPTGAAAFEARLRSPWRRARARREAARRQRIEEGKVVLEAWQAVENGSPA